MRYIRTPIIIIPWVAMDVFVIHLLNLTVLSFFRFPVVVLREWGLSLLYSLLTSL
jgi:hypothetical protein